MEVVRTGPDLAPTAAARLTEALAGLLADKPRVSLALSGGRTPWPILEILAEAALDWERVDVFQVDERIAPAGDLARNLTGLAAALLDRVPATVHPMPVEDPDPEAAARRYAADLPASLDIVHLGLGDDGHTASLVPGDPSLDARDTDVTVTGEYRGHRRMTLTFPALERAGSIVWIVSGADKAPMIERLLASDPTIPAGRVPHDRALLITDVNP